MIAAWGAIMGVALYVTCSIIRDILWDRRHRVVSPSRRRAMSALERIYRRGHQ